MTKFGKEELENSKRIFKSATPKYTPDWYIKWVASAFVLGAMSIRGVDGMQQTDLILSLIGIVGWLIVSILWRDRALIMLNGAGLLFLINHRGLSGIKNKRRINNADGIISKPNIPRQTSKTNIL